MFALFILEKHRVMLEGTIPESINFTVLFEEKPQMPENDDQQFSKAKREGWSAEEISEESTNMPPDEIKRQMLRGDETQGNADDRDVAGSANSNETPQAREQSKNE